MRWRVKGPGPEVVEQVPINEEYAVRRFRIYLVPDTPGEPESTAIQSMVIDGSLKLPEIEASASDEDTDPRILE